MDIAEILGDAMKTAIEAEGQRLVEQAKQMRPIIVGDLTDATLSYAAFVEYGQPPNTIDSTAIVIDENVKALPAPQEEKHG